MKVDIMFKDSKGITEYTKEECEDPQLKKQIKNAESILEMVIKKLCKRYPLLHPAIRYFECVAVKEEIILETDGKYVFYQPQKIEKIYVTRTLRELELKYLHFVLHGLLGHFYIHQKLGTDFLWDAIMDYEVAMITNSMMSRNIRDAGRKRLGMRGLYWYAQKQPKIAAQLREQKIWDNHKVWERGTEKKIGSLQLEKSEGDGSGTEMTDIRLQGFPLEAEEEYDAEEKWKAIQEMIGMGKEMNPQNLKKILNSKLAGKEKGYGAEIYEAAEENGNSYREYIRQFLKEREIVREQDGTIDKMLYSFGFELYGDVAFIEPEEYSENKAMKKVVIAIDTSGSCCGDIMNEFLRETKNLLQDISEISSFEEVILMQCDTEIQKEEHFYDVWEFPEENSREMKGFGGTDFRPVFKRVQEIIETEHAEVDFLVYFSDGYGNFPKEEPAYPVFFVLSEEEENVRLPDWVMPVWYRNM